MFNNRPASRRNSHGGPRQHCHFQVQSPQFARGGRGGVRDHRLLKGCPTFGQLRCRLLRLERRGRCWDVQPVRQQRRDVQPVRLSEGETQRQRKELDLGCSTAVLRPRLCGFEYFLGLNCTRMKNKRPQYYESSTMLPIL